MAFDVGVAPNPYGEACTLALCKPDIRRTSEVGDLIVGLTSITLGHKLVYAMYVNEILTLADYFLDPRYDGKKPNFSSADHHEWMGDNVYERTGDDHIQHPSYFNIEGRSAESFDKKKVTDVERGENVLISDRFWYFGKQAPSLPVELDFLHDRLRRGHRVFKQKAIGKFERYGIHLLRNLGVQGEPRDLDKRAAKLEYLHEN